MGSGLAGGRVREKPSAISPEIEGGGPQPGAGPGRRLLPAGSPPMRRPPPAAGPRLDPADAQVGLEVVHRAFGAGRVLSAAGSTVTVEFASGTKVLDLTLAPMSAAS